MKTVKSQSTADVAGGNIKINYYQLFETVSHYCIVYGQPMYSIAILTIYFHFLHSVVYWKYYFTHIVHPYILPIVHYNCQSF